MTRTTQGNVELQIAVAAALERSDELPTTLGVSAHEGTVTLAGSVSDEVHLVAAQNIAGNVPGVAEVAVEIALRRPRGGAG